jgi:hypothetical protein
VGIIVAAHRSEIERLGTPAFSMDNQSFAAGRSIGTYVAAPYSYTDVNGDGLLAPSEVVALIEESGPVGSPFPDYEAALRTGMSVGSLLHLSAIVDRRAGATLFNETARLRCRTRCEEQHDPSTPLAEQARSVAALKGGQIAYFEDADYTRLREVRVALTLPSRLARLAGASSARFSVTGRNLYTWTRYSGLDPEIISEQYDSIGAADSFYQPPIRSFMARLDLAW